MKQIRTFFDALGYTQVDPPALSFAPSIDAHIDPIAVRTQEGKTGYLHTSPEYAMKRLLSKYKQNIYALCHVFRDNESGPLHALEFTMIEWYRIEASYRDFIEETLALCRLFLGPLQASTLTYRQAFIKYLNRDPFRATVNELAPHAQHRGAPLWDKDTLLQTLFSLHVEPHLKELTVITEFPATQAALAQIRGNVAERFEIYYRGVELANGFHELTHATEQRERLCQENKKRAALGKQELPLDESFLRALKRGIPDCCGVAVGFDRLLMLSQNLSSIHPLLP